MFQTIYLARFFPSFFFGFFAPSTPHLLSPSESAAFSWLPHWPAGPAAWRSPMISKSLIWRTSRWFTLPEINVAPENWCLETRQATFLFKWRHICFRESTLPEINDASETLVFGKCFAFSCWEGRLGRCYVNVSEWNSKFDVHAILNWWVFQKFNIVNDFLVVPFLVI